MVDTEAFRCPLCMQGFATQGRRPYQIPCGHSVCEECLKEGQEEKRHCERVIPRIEQLKVNFALDEMVAEKEVMCSQHSRVLATYFCMGHMVALCQECRASHVVLYSDGPDMLLELSTNEVRYKLQAALISMEKDLNDPPTVRHLIRRGSLPVKEMIRKLTHFYTPIRCLNCDCDSREVVWFNPQGPAFACSEAHKDQHTDTGLGFYEWIPLPLGDITQVLHIMLDHAKKLLRLIPSAHLTYEELQVYKTRLVNSEAPQVLNLLYDLQINLLKNRNQPWPDFAQCLVCKEQYNTSKSAQSGYFTFKCINTAHEICSKCANSMLPTGVLTCPVDDKKFAVQGNEFDFHSEITESSSNYFRTDDGSGKSGESGVTLTNLPPHTRDSHYLELFPTVTPALGTRVEDCEGNNKGWFIDPTKHSVETIVMNSFREVRLVGFLFSTPVERGVQVVMDWIKVYSGNSAVGDPVYQHNTAVRLVGGNYVAQDVLFTRPVPVDGQCTIKVKLTCSRPGLLVLFRGNSLEKLDIWTSSCDDIWVFEDCKGLETGEYPNGQSHSSGPFLRLYYI